MSRSGRTRAVALRVGAFLGTLAGAVALIQGLIALAPGDAIDLLPNADVVRDTLAHEWGLDQPLPLRIVSALGRAATLDLGTSLTYRPGTPVLELVTKAAAESSFVLLPAWVLSVTVGLATAWWTSAGRAGGRLVQAVSVVPAFLMAWSTVTALNAAVWAGMERGWWDRPEWFALPDTESGVRTALAITVLAVASGNLAHLHTVCEAELRALRAAPFIEAARARGARVTPHLVHNLLPPVLDLAAGRAAALLGTLVVVEKLLLLNGAGAMLWQSCVQRDFPLATGLVLAAAAFAAGVRLAADLARLAVDPRLVAPEESPA